MNHDSFYRSNESALNNKVKKNDDKIVLQLFSSDGGTQVWPGMASFG